MRGNPKHTKTSEQTDMCCGRCCMGDKQAVAVPKGTCCHWGVGQLAYGIKIAWELEVAGSCSCWCGFTKWATTAASCTPPAEVALGGWHLSLMESSGSSHTGDRILSKTASRSSVLWLPRDSPGGDCSLSSEQLSQGLLMALSEALCTAVLSCTCGACTAGLFVEVAAWHPNGSRRWAQRELGAEAAGVS